MGLPKLTETNAQCEKEARMEVENKIMGEPHVDYNECQILT